MSTVQASHAAEKCCCVVCLRTLSEILLGHPYFDSWVMCVRIEHNNRIRQYVCRVRRVESSRVIAVVLFGEFFHHAIDFLSLTGQTETLHEITNRIVEQSTGELGGKKREKQREKKQKGKSKKINVSTLASALRPPSRMLSCFLLFLFYVSLTFICSVYLYSTSLLNACSSPKYSPN